MPLTVLTRVPVVAGLGYVERVSTQPSSFEVTLAVEPGHRYFRNAIAVSAGGQKLGYLAPEVAWDYFDQIAASGPVSCPARRSSLSDHQTSGVELLLDLSGLSIPADGTVRVS
jgi:hypothetical protein